ncbi:hypothetical protein [Arthrobacter sp. U41]|uniref:hypothetical protein n=1 Tax=Arthrobacter sp. U41 TaxID=1849032 RepID=UPI0011A36A91|nr:hypothetical protein [Arthrobacter sp. U41]
MSGLDDLMAQSQDRWASAARSAQGLADEGLGEAVKAYYMLYLPVGLVVLISIGSLSAMFALGDDPANWASYLTFGFVLAALGAMIGGLIYNARRVRPAAELGSMDVMLSLQEHEQKHVRRQILGKAAVEPEHLGVTRGAAVQLRKNLATQLVMAPPLPLVFIPQAVPGSSEIWWLMAMVLGAQAVAAILLAREFRQTGRFLSHTAGQMPAMDA